MRDQFTNNDPEEDILLHMEDDRPGYEDAFPETVDEHHMGDRGRSCKGRRSDGVEDRELHTGLPHSGREGRRTHQVVRGRGVASVRISHGSRSSRAEECVGGSRRDVDCNLAAVHGDRSSRHMVPADSDGPLASESGTYHVHDHRGHLAHRTAHEA